MNNMVTKIETTTARERELFAMLFEKNTMIDQLSFQKSELEKEVEKLREELSKRDQGSQE